MYENKWTLSTDKTDWVKRSGSPQVPILKITFNGNSSECRDHLSETSLVRRMPSTVDVTFRLQAEQDGLNVDGILGVANARGEYIVECEGNGGQIIRILEGANKYADCLNDVGQYELSIEATDGLVERWVETALIVFSAEGEVIKDLSLVSPGLDL